MSLAGTESTERKRIIFHIDFDYFFAQCEEMRDASLKDRPVVVCVYSARGGDSGAVSTANYRAREYGVKSGIPIKFAKNRLKSVPDAVFLKVDHGYYEAISDRAMGVLRTYADKFELVGVDEAYIEVSERLGHDFGAAEELAKEIKGALRKEPSLSVSIGVAPNKLIAKIASDFKKPDGLTIVNPEGVREFLSDLDVSKISGIGKKTAQGLNDEMKVRTIGELAGIDIYTLTKEFGKKTGAYIFSAARGIDEEPLLEDESQKQISRINTLKKNTNSIKEMLGDLEALCNDVHAAVVEERLLFKTIGIELVLDDLSHKTRSRSLRSPSGSREELLRVARALLEQAVAAETELLVRRLGVKVSDLTSSKGQDTLSKFMNEGRE